MPVIVTKSDGRHLRKATYTSKQEAAEALNTTVATINRWILNHHGYRPSKDLLQICVRVEADKQAAKPLKKKPAPKPKRQAQARQNDHFYGVFGVLCVVAVWLGYLAI